MYNNQMYFIELVNDYHIHLNISKRNNYAFSQVDEYNIKNVKKFTMFYSFKYIFYIYYLPSHIISIYIIDRLGVKIIEMT